MKVQALTRINPTVCSKLIARSLSYDMRVGKPDSVSNIRPITIKRHKNDTRLESHLKNLQEKTQQWHHEFWLNHNKKFLEEREEYIKSHQSKNAVTSEVSPLSPEEMAVFHRDFLFTNYPLLRNYDRNGYWRSHT